MTSLMSEVLPNHLANLQEIHPLLKSSDGRTVDQGANLSHVLDHDMQQSFYRMRLGSEQTNWL